MPDQAQVLTQAEHAFKIMPHKLLIEQEHEQQVLGAFTAGLVVRATVGQGQGITAGDHRAINGKMGGLLTQLQPDSVQ